MRPLPVEDQPKRAFLIRKGFENEGCMIDPAYQGRMGKSMFDSNACQLILPDLILPDTDLPSINGFEFCGFEFCRIIRQTGSPVPMLTAPDGIGTSEAALPTASGLELQSDQTGPETLNNTPVMQDTYTKRVSRLIAVLTQLQTKRFVTASALAKRFSVSVRTIYRDMRVLEQAGVPLLTEDGKGYSLLEGYRIPPVMFTESQANALITVEQLVMKNQDSSLVDHYAQAVSKIRAVLVHATREKAELLSTRVAVSPALAQATTSHWLTVLQSALTDCRVLHIGYHSRHGGQRTRREIEPFALYYSLRQSWILIAYCRLRNDFRMFHLDRIESMEPTGSVFTAHTMTLAQYLAEKEKNFTHP